MVDKSKMVKVDVLRQKFSGTDTAVLADFRGLNVQQMTELRRRLRESSVDYMVVKNTLARLASRETPFQALSELFTGPVSVAFSGTDEVAAARVLTAFADEEPALRITGGLLEGKVITLEEVVKLAKLPPREQLLSQMLLGMKSPLAGMVTVLGGVVRNLLYTLKAIEEKKKALDQ